jgi:PAS domain S-box-containing protein
LSEESASFKRPPYLEGDYMALEKDMEIAPPPDAMATTGPAADAARAVILNVDDCEGIRYTRSRVLANAGYRVIEAGTGEEAMLLAGSLQPAVIVLDVQLPDVDGLDVCRKIKGDPHTTHIMVLQVSAVKSAALDRAAALDAGADAYLIEPIDPVELIATVKALLRLSAREAENRRLLTHLRLSAQSRGLPPDLEPAKTMAEQGRLLDLSHDAIVVRDAGDRIVYWSRGAEALYGWRQEEALGRKIHRLLHTEFPQALEEILAALHRDRYWSGELVHRTREGARITVMTRWIPDVDQPRTRGGGQGAEYGHHRAETDGGVVARTAASAQVGDRQRERRAVHHGRAPALCVHEPGG